jgi:hypothetical protein
MANKYSKITAPTVEQINNRFKDVWAHFGTLTVSDSGGSGGTGVTDGDKGEVVVSNSGASWLVKSGLSADKLVEGATNKLLSATERNKLSGIQNGATVNSTDASLRDRSTHTGTQTADTITDGTANKVYSAAEKLKLAAVAANATLNSTDAFLLNRQNHTGQQTADTVIDGTLNKAYTATERNKLSGIATGATANASDAQLRDRSTHTGTQNADSITDGSTNKAYTAADKSKLAGVAPGATANSSDTQLRDRATHTGTQTAATIADFTEAVQDAVAALLGAGSNVILNYDDANNSLSISATGSGGAGLDPEQVRDVIGVALIGAGLITVNVNDAADTITITTTATQNSTDAQLRDRSTHTGTQNADSITDGTTNKAYTAAEKVKLAGVAVGATANATDAALRDRATHTGTQSADSITDGTTNKAYTATEKSKLASIPTQTEAITLDDSITDGSTSQGLPRTAAVAAYVATKMSGGGGGGGGIGQALFPPNARYVAFGDDMTGNGFFANTTTSQYQTGFATWALQLSGGYYMPKGGNLGVGGNSTVNMLARIGVIASFQPHVVTVLAGANDIVYGISQAAIKANLREIYDTIIAVGAKVIAVTILQRFGSSVLSAGQETDRLAINTWIKSQSDITVIDAEGALNTAGFFESDGHSPNALGSYTLGALVAAQMRTWITTSLVANALAPDITLSPNPTMSGPFGGKEAGATGTIADSWQLSGPAGAGGATIDGQKYVGPNGKEAQDVTISGNYTGNFQKVMLYNLNDTPTSLPKVGTLIEALADVEIITPFSSSVETVYVEVHMQGPSFGATITKAYSLYQSGQPLTMPAGRYSLRTPPIDMKAGTVGEVWVDLTIQLKNASVSTPVSGQIRIYSMGARIVPPEAESLSRRTFNGLNTNAKQLVEAVNETFALAQAGGGGGGGSIAIDSTIIDGSNNPPTGNAVYDALQLKQDKLPSIAGQSGKILGTDGTILHWVTDQVGGSGSLPTSSSANKRMFLMSNGTAAAWDCPLDAIPSRLFAAGDATATIDTGTDDTTNLNNWAVAGNHLYLEKGYYRVSDKIVFASRNNIKITAHPEAYIVRSSSFPTTASDGSGSRAIFDFRICDHVHLDGIRVLDSGQTVNVPGSGCVLTQHLDTFYFKTCNYVTLKNIYITYPPKAGFRIFNCSNIHIETCKVLKATGFCFEINSTPWVKVIGNTFTGRGQEHSAAATPTGSGTTNPFGINLNGLFTLCDHVQCYLNFFDDSYDTNTKTEGCNYVNYGVNQITRSGKDGVKSMGYNTVGCTNINFVGNIVEYLYDFHPQGSGLIVCDDADNFTIVGNTVKGGLKLTTNGHPEIGISVNRFTTTFTPKNGVISSNEIFSPTYVGIQVQEGQSILISNNTISEYATAGQANSHGIYVSPGATANNINISVIGNEIVRTAIPSASNSDSAICLRKIVNPVVRDNKIIFPKQAGITLDLMSSDYANISDNEFLCYDTVNSRASSAPCILIKSYAASQVIEEVITNGNYGVSGHAAIELDTINNNDATKTMSVALWSAQSNIFKAKGSVYKMILRHYGAAAPVARLYTQNNITEDSNTILYDFATNGVMPTIWQVGEYQYRGNGSPETIVPAPPSAKYQRLDGSAGTFWYQKNSGLAATGWAAIS